RGFLSEKLPDYMIPAAFMTLSALPLTASGKADRKSLPHPETVSHREYRPPRTQSEETLCALCAKILGLERVGLDDHFFEAGGDSILALQLVAQARSKGLHLSVRDIFKAPRLEELCARVAHDPVEPVWESDASSAAVPPEVEAFLRKRYPQLETVLPLTPLQQGILFHARADEGAYQLELRLRAEGCFEPERFRAAWQQVLERHQVLRMAIPPEESDFAAILSHVELPFLFEDRRSFGDSTPAEEIHHPWLDQVFDLAQAPLLRLAIFQVEDRAWEIVLVNHHITLDGWSLSIVLGDVLKLYRGEVLPKASPFADYACWLRGRPQDMGWWQALLKDFDTPNRILLPSGKDDGFGEYTFSLGKNLSARLIGTAQRLGSTPGIVLQTIWALLVARLSNTSDVVFGQVVSGRPAELPDIASRVGMFINTVPVRLKMTGKTLRMLVGELTEQQGARSAHEGDPLPQIQAQAPVPKGTPLFETLFVYENYPLDEGLKESAGQDFVLCNPRGQEAPHYPLAIAVLPGANFTLQLTYRRNFLENATRIALWFCNLLETALSRCDAPLCDLSLLDAVEYEAVTRGFNRTQRPIPQGSTLHDLFEAQVDLHPQAPALLSDDAHLSYAQLNTRANHIAHQVVEHLSHGEKRIVGICMERGFDLVAALLGVLKAGCAYLPLDPSLPVERLHLMLRDAGAAGVIVCETTCECFEGFEKLVLDEARFEDDEVPNPHLAVGEKDLAYVIYTSGSTGQPKGVLVEHRSIVNKVVTLPDLLGESCLACALVTASFSFDPFIEQLMLGLHCGQPVRLLDEAELTDPARFWALIQKYGVRRVDLTPSLALPLFEHLPAEPLPLTHLLLGGEAVPHALIQLLAEKAPQL
ncbi:MAG: AMP-binding protein, partial [Deltaproteobacteria bacterium]|nr:AMP-binding protein [Deltaproteobacteria bacterium]